MSGDQLDLDGIEKRRVLAGDCSAFDPYGHLAELVSEDVPALVAEVRRLREQVAGLGRAEESAECGLREQLLREGFE